MFRLSLNKSALHKEQTQLVLYQKVLPSLDLKRKQLLMETNRAKKALGALKSQMKEYAHETAKMYPMLSDKSIESLRLVRIERVRLGSRNVAGLELPELEKIDFSAPDYPLLGTPVWTELISRRMHKVIKMEIETDITHRRIWLLERALKKITQRVNLFEKVLIPETKERIKKITIALDDIQRSSVIRSKIAKAKHSGERR